jgi:predicted metal-dependent phosphoesterase TrpH
MLADLHLHSTFSDGTFAPEEIARRARLAGLRTVALTDHDSVAGCERMAAACAAEGVEFIPGTELTAEMDGLELHLLGYFIHPRHKPLLAELDRFQEVRIQRIRDITARLQSLGVGLEAEAVLALANCRSPGRPHVARALVEGGYCATFDEAFERFLKKDRPAWVPKFKISAPDAILLIHRAGGAAVLAHPVLNRCDHLIPALAAAGLDGLECFHTKHSTADAARYQSLAQQHGLLVTGGSDCHGSNKGRPLIGTVTIPCSLVEPLRLCAARHGVAYGPQLAAAV